VQVRDAMSSNVLTAGPDRSLREVAGLMAERNVGAVVVIDPELPGPGIVTERDVSQAVGRGGDPDRERVVDHISTNATQASSDWSLDEAAKAMTSGGFRHLVVIDGGDLVGVLSMRDVVRVWSESRG
jgi:CBS domain-containing protein